MVDADAAKRAEELVLVWSNWDVDHPDPDPKFRMGLLVAADALCRRFNIGYPEEFQEAMNRAGGSLADDAPNLRKAAVSLYRALKELDWMLHLPPEKRKATDFSLLCMVREALQQGEAALPELREKAEGGNGDGEGSEADKKCPRCGVVLAGINTSERARVHDTLCQPGVLEEFRRVNRDWDVPDRPERCAGCGEEMPATMAGLWDVHSEPATPRRWHVACYRRTPADFARPAQETGMSEPLADAVVRGLVQQPRPSGEPNLCPECGDDLDRQECGSECAKCGHGLRQRPKGGREGENMGAGTVQR